MSELPYCWKASVTENSTNISTNHSIALLQFLFLIFLAKEARDKFLFGLIFLDLQKLDR